MIAPLTALLSAAVTAGVVADGHTTLPADLTRMPALAVGARGLEAFRLNERGEVLSADSYAELYLITGLNDLQGRHDPQAAEKADAALGALFELIPSHGFRPGRTTQVEAHWGNREVIVCQLRVTRPNAITAIPATT